MLDSQPLLLVVALLLVGGGFLIGLALGRSSRKLEARVRELEGELADSHASLARYREEVGSHFGKTSDLLRDLTLQYRAVYDHLAEGASSLCPDLSNGLPAGGVERLLAEHSETRDAASQAAASAARPVEAGGGGAQIADDDANLDELEIGGALAETAQAEAAPGEPLRTAAH